MTVWKEIICNPCKKEHSEYTRPCDFFLPMEYEQKWAMPHKDQGTQAEGLPSPVCFLFYHLDIHEHYDTGNHVLKKVEP